MDWMMPELPPEALARDRSIAQKFTRMTTAIDEDWPDAHAAWLTVGLQHFRIEVCETRQEAGEHCLLLAKAMMAVIDSAVSGVPIEGPKVAEHAGSAAAQPSAASAGSGLYRVECVFHWSAQTDKGHQRICANAVLHLPFVPAVGQCIELAEELPSPKIKEVVWQHWDSSFYAHCRVRLKDWDSKLFESLMGDIRDAGLGLKPKLFDDNWMYQIKGK